jgi:hypothetical protein
MNMQHTPAPELDAETIEAAAARVAAMNLSANKPSIAAEIHAIREETKDLPPLDASQAIVIRNGRKPRSDKGTKRTPKAQTLSIEAVSAMTPEQADELVRLVAARNETLKNWEDAKDEALKCAEHFKADAQALQDFLEALAVTK